MRWSDPPPEYRRQGTYTGRRFAEFEPHIALLMEHPNRWAVLSDDFAGALATPLRERFPTIEFTARRLAHNRRGRVTLYARYQPAQGDSP